MTTEYVRCGAGPQIAYDVTGSGPALILLHGAGKARKDWHSLGYVRRLDRQFRVITVDARGSGESERRTGIADFAVDGLCDDILAVADACGAERFAVWGYSFGGTIARHLAVRSDRLTALAVIGVPLGPAVTPEFEQYIGEFVARYGPQADPGTGSPARGGKRSSSLKGSIPVWVACFQAMREWPAVEPGQLCCPTLLAAGTRNRAAGAWIEANRQALADAGIRIERFAGLDHPQEFSQVEQVLPVVSEFFAGVVGNDRGG